MDLLPFVLGGRPKAIKKLTGFLVEIEHGDHEILAVVESQICLFWSSPESRRSDGISTKIHFDFPFFRINLSVSTNLWPPVRGRPFIDWGVRKKKIKNKTKKHKRYTLCIMLNFLLSQSQRRPPIHYSLDRYIYIYIYRCCLSADFRWVYIYYNWIAF